MPIDCLLLVPTDFEWNRLSAMIVGPTSLTVDAGGDVDSAELSVRICGFGPIAAAARAAALIAELRPSRVVLAGIAGSYSESLQVGSAYEFDSVSSHGVGVGSGDDFVTAGELGWHQFHDSTCPDLSITDTLRLSPVSKSALAGMLLTCCSGSVDSQDAAIKTAKFPDAVAEDMEAFGVAVSCAIAGVPLSVVRGISNRAGDRDHVGWKVDEALAAVAVILNAGLERSG